MTQTGSIYGQALYMLALEESIALYEEGKMLAAQLSAQLEEQKKRIEMIDPDTAEIETFEGDEHGVS